MRPTRIAGRSWIPGGHGTSRHGTSRHGTSGRSWIPGGHGTSSHGTSRYGTSSHGATGRSVPPGDPGSRIAGTVEAIGRMIPGGMPPGISWIPGGHGTSGIPGGMRPIAAGRRMTDRTRGTLEVTVPPVTVPPVGGGHGTSSHTRHRLVGNGRVGFQLSRRPVQYRRQTAPPLLNCMVQATGYSNEER